MTNKFKSKKSMLRTISTVAVLVALSGCSDPKAASEKNFKIAAQAYLDSVYPKCYHTETFPVTRDYIEGEKRNVLPALVKAGLLSEQELSRVETRSWSGDGKFLVKSAFSLTEDGRKFYMEPAKTPGQDKSGGFCLGKAEVTELARFTEPSEISGHRISRVNYSYAVKELPGWAKSEDIQAAIPDLKADAESAIEALKRTDTFVLTNTGWMHQALFSR